MRWTEVNAFTRGNVNLHIKGLTITACKLLTKTSLVVLFTESFIASITAVILSIALPPFGDTVTRRATKTARPTGFVVTDLFTLIPVILTIVVLVTQPRRVYTHIGVATFGLSRWTCNRRAVSFIREISTIVVTVTFPIKVYAVPICTCEPVRGALLFGAVFLVAAVCTIPVKIAFPSRKNTLSTFAPEFV